MTLRRGRAFRPAAAEMGERIVDGNLAEAGFERRGKAISNAPAQSRPFRSPGEACSLRALTDYCDTEVRHGEGSISVQASRSGGAPGAVGWPRWLRRSSETGQFCGKVTDARDVAETSTTPKMRLE